MIRNCILTYLRILSLVLFSGSCTSELTGPSVIEGVPVNISVDMNTKALGEGESKITHLRFSILDEAGVAVYLNELIDPYTSDKFQRTTLSGMRDIYFFANEPLNSGLGGDNLTAARIGEAEISYSPIPDTDGKYIPAVIPMVDVLDNQTLLSGQTSGQKLNPMLKRRMAKITVNLTYADDPNAGIYRYELKNVQIVELPKKYYWVNKSYPVENVTQDLINSEMQICETSTDMNGVVSSSNDFYVPSYLVSGDNCAKIKVTVDRISRNTGSSIGAEELFLSVGDAAKPENPRWDLTPNRHYNADITVKQNPTMMVRIIDWGTEDISGNPHEKYQIKIEDGIDEIPYNYSEHPLVYSDNQGRQPTGNRVFTLARISRLQTGGAPLPAETPLTVELKASPGAPTSGFALQHSGGGTTDISNNKYAGTIGNMSKGFQVNITGNDTYEFEYIIHMGNLTYHSTPISLSKGGTKRHMFNSNETQRFIDLGRNINRNDYEIRVYYADSEGREVYTTTNPGSGDFQLTNTNNTNGTLLQQKIDFFSQSGKEEMPNWNRSTTYTFWFTEDNSRPVWWDMISGNASGGVFPTHRYKGADPYTDYRAIPRFRDKVMDIVERSTGKVFIRIKQARPYYYGFFDENGNESIVTGNHKIAAGYNGYDDNAHAGNVYYRPHDGNSNPYSGVDKMTRSRGSYFSLYSSNSGSPIYGNAIGLVHEYSDYWQGDGAHNRYVGSKAKTGWHLPKAQKQHIGSESAVSDNEIFKMFDRCFRGGRTGSIAAGHRHYNDDVINAGSEVTPRINFLPRSGQSSNNNYNQGRYHAGIPDYSGSTLVFHLFIDSGGTISIYNDPPSVTTAMSVRPVRNVK